MTAEDFTARLGGRAFDIGRAAWNACAGTEHPFTRYEFFDAVESSGSATARTGWRPLHLTVERGDGVEGILPLYLKNHSQGEYVFDHAWADALERAGVDYYPKLQASVPFTPATGRRFLTKSDDARAALLAAGRSAVVLDGDRNGTPVQGAVAELPVGVVAPALRRSVGQDRARVGTAGGDRRNTNRRGATHRDCTRGRNRPPERDHREQGEADPSHHMPPSAGAQFPTGCPADQRGAEQLSCKRDRGDRRALAPLAGARAIVIWCARGDLNPHALAGTGT